MVSKSSGKASTSLNEQIASGLAHSKPALSHNVNASSGASHSTLLSFPPSTTATSNAINSRFGEYFFFIAREIECIFIFMRIRIAKQLFYLNFSLNRLDHVRSCVAFGLCGRRVESTTELAKYKHTTQIRSFGSNSIVHLSSMRIKALGNLLKAKKIVVCVQESPPFCVANCLVWGWGECVVCVFVSDYTCD